MRIFLVMLIALSTLASAQDARILAHAGCPVQFTVPDDWSGDATNRCTYKFTRGQQEIDVTLYSGSLDDAGILYWGVADDDETVQPIKLGGYEGVRRERPRIYVLSNGDLVVVAVSFDREDVSRESFETLLRRMRFTGRSKKGNRQHHPVLFDRKCGVSADYPDDFIAKPGGKECSVELYSAWPPPAKGHDIVEVADGFPEDWCISDRPGDFPPEITTVKNSDWTLFKEDGSGRGYGLAGYQGLRDWETWIFTDGCRTLTIQDPSEKLSGTLLQSLKFSPTQCEQKITEVPKCKN